MLVEDRQFYLRQMYLASALGAISLEFYQDLWRQKTRVLKLAYRAVAWMVIGSFVRFSTIAARDGRTDGRTDRTGTAISMTLCCANAR